MAGKEAKSPVVYAALALILIIVSVVLANAVISYSAGDSDLSISYNLVTEEKAGRVYTPQCFTECHLPVCITPSGSSLNSAIPFTDKDITQTLDFAEGSDQSILKEMGTDYLTTETYTIDIPVYGTCEEQRINNQTGENETFSYNCLLETQQEQRTIEVWKPLKEISQLNLESGKEQCFDIWGKLQPRLNGNFAVDVIPRINLQDKDFVMWELAWWNETGVNYKRPLTFNTTRLGDVRIPFVINGSEGINGSTIWTVPEQNLSNSSNYTQWLYYNSWNDLYVVNQSENATRSHEVENGTAPSNNPKSVWLNNHLPYVFHMNGSASNASGGSGTSSGVTYTNAGKFGQAAVFDSSSDYMSIGDIDETANSGKYSTEFWIYPTSTPGSWSHVFNNWDRAVSIRYHSSGALKFDSNSPSNCGSGAEFTTNQSLTQNQWNHVVTVVTGSGTNQGLTVWINGAMVLEATHCSDVHTGDANIGYSSSGFAEGRIDEFRFYNKTLTNDEVVALYEQGNYRRSELGSVVNNTGTASEAQGDTGISQGITGSLINLSYVATANQRFQTRTDTGVQNLGIFDWVVSANNNQTWLFNYVSPDENTSTFTYMVNITPVVYVWEASNKTMNQISNEVATFINYTYNSSI